MRPLALSALLALLPAFAHAQEPTLELAFMPPVVVPQDICTPGATADEEETDTGDHLTEDAVLTDELRLRYIQRDIRNYQARTPPAGSTSSRP